MFFPESRVRVYLYGQAVDMRKSFDGLYAVARAAFPQDPTGGDLYVFVNRSVTGNQTAFLRISRSRASPSAAAARRSAASTAVA